MVTILILLGVIVLFFAYYFLWFLRDPKITIPAGNNLVSPASGTVSKIIRIEKGNVPDTLQIDKGLLGKIQTRVKPILGNQSGYIISIVMTPLDVHYQYAPCDGVVESVRHRKGKFLNAVQGASGMRATLENEHAEIVLKCAAGKIAVYPIAGFVARRIHTFVTEGQKVKKGDKLGIIKLGSQVSTIIPDLNVKVSESQHLSGGVDILAEY